MNYQHIQHFFAMGGYGIYIWPAYIVTFTVLIINVLQPFIHHKQLLNQTIIKSFYIKSQNTHVTSS